MLNLTEHPDFIRDDDTYHPIPNFTDAWDLEAVDRAFHRLASLATSTEHKPFSDLSLQKAAANGS